MSLIKSLQSIKQVIFVLSKRTEYVLEIYFNVLCNGTKHGFHDYTLDVDSSLGIFIRNIVRTEKFTKNIAFIFGNNDLSMIIITMVGFFAKSLKTCIG